MQRGQLPCSFYGTSMLVRSGMVIVFVHVFSGSSVFVGGNVPIRHWHLARRGPQLFWLCVCVTPLWWLCGVVCVV